MTQADDQRAMIEAIRQNVNNGGYNKLLGMKVEKIEAGKGTVHISVDARLMHAQQIVHGGVIFTLADTAMSMAIISIIPPHTRFSTIEAKINYLQPVRSGELLAEAHLIQRGRSIAVLEATVYNINGDERQAVARVLGTFSISSSTYKPTQDEEKSA